MKKITFGISDKPDLGDLLLLTPLFKHNCDCTMQFTRTSRGVRFAELFEGLTNIEFVDNVLTDAEYYNKYGNLSKKLPLSHACKSYASIFGIETNDFIPYIKITEKDIRFADNFLKGLKNPITFAPVAGGLGVGDDSFARSKMLHPDNWNKITEELSKNHDILYFSSSSKNFPVKNVINMFDLTYREMCAIFNKCKKHIGIENGLLHAAIASGSKVFAVVPGFGWNIGYYFPNYGYTDDMWNLEPKRCFYYLFNDYLKILENF